MNKQENNHKHLTNNEVQQEVDNPDNKKLNELNKQAGDCELCKGILLRVLGTTKRKKKK